MSKFYVGQKVFVRDSTFLPCDGSRNFVGRESTIKWAASDFSHYRVYNEFYDDWFGFNPCDLMPITETPETLTINGVEYIRKPDTVVEHEWKFGDIAVHEEYGVVLVGGTYSHGRVKIFTDKEFTTTNPHELTFIRRADLSV